MNTLEEIAESMYREYGSKTSVLFFEDYRASLAAFDAMDVLVYQFKRFSREHSYVLKFLMAAYYLWEEFSAEDWITLMRRNSPRMDPTSEIDIPAQFCDIEVLERYFGLNALQVYLSDEEISESDKRNTAKYFEIHSFYLDRDDFLDHDDLNGVYLIEESYLLKIKSRLLDRFSEKLV
jgi:hypothetical protein